MSPEEIVTKVEAAIKMADALLEAIAAAGDDGVSPGAMYAILCAHLTLRDFELLLDVLLGAELVSGYRGTAPDRRRREPRYRHAPGRTPRELYITEKGRERVAAMVPQR